MIKLYLETLTILLTDIKQGIESENKIVNNGCLNKITRYYYNDDKQRISLVFADKDKDLRLLFITLQSQVKHFYADRQSKIRKEYVNRTFSEIRGLLMQKILFDSESGLKL